jgi:FkbM family methyltransferase
MQAGSVEREWIERCFQGRVGRFLEIGSYDGVSTSLTAGLIDAGWRGVMVEPNPEVFARLLHNRGDNPRLTLVNAAVAGVHSVRPFHVIMDGVPGEDQTCTLSAEFAADRAQRGSKYRDIYVSSCTPIELLDGVRGNDALPYTGWHLVVIDAEGMGLPIVQGFPWAAMNDTEIVCVETFRDADKLTECLSPFYELALHEPPNMIWRRRHTISP